MRDCMVMAFNLFYFILFYVLIELIFSTPSPWEVQTWED